MSNNSTPQKKWYKKTWVVVSGAATLAFIVGAGVGASNPAPAPEPKVVTKTVTKTETKEVEKTPLSCLKALDEAQSAFQIVANVVEATSDYPTMVGEAAQAGFDADADALDDILKRMEKVTDTLSSSTSKLNKIDFAASAEACRSADGSAG